MVYGKEKSEGIVTRGPQHRVAIRPKLSQFLFMFVSFYATHEHANSKTCKLSLLLDSLCLLQLNFLFAAVF